MITIKNQSITCILHGGQTSRASPDNDLFFRQFTELVPKANVNILMCYWAREKSQWDKLLKRDRVKILAQSSKKVSFTIVKYPEDLFKQLKTHYVLYVAGGSVELIVPLVPEIMSLKDHLKGKVYIGSSMGTFVASEHYVSSSDNKDTSSVHNGIELAPLNTLCHWDVEPEKNHKIELLKRYAPTTPILTLDECKYATIVV